ncbi:MAG: 4Fe-4S binding protein [Clostridia bacterium]|nr:4Fe-4S binding protein [Clostridia bacterium]
MIRRIIHIDQEKCNGCGACAKACHEGAIGMINGKAVLLRDDYCDGLGDCLPACPANAISFVEREALAYDEEAVRANMANKKTGFTCPGSMVKNIKKEPVENKAEFSIESQLRQWPIQIKLAPVNASYFSNAHLLIAADCSAYAYGDFHNKFMRNKVTLIGCPKLDSVDYSEKLTEIIINNDIKSITVVRMEVPCCGGIENAVKKALIESGKLIPWSIVTVSADGRIIE